MNCKNLVIPDLSLPNLLELKGASFRGTKIQQVSNLGSITALEGSTFQDCTSLTRVVMPSTLLSIGAYDFYGCTSLASITIPNSVTNIGEGSFRSCTSLGYITIPNSVNTIRSDAFRQCSHLTSVTIGSGITNMGKRVFQQCPALTSLTVNSITPPVLEDASLLTSSVNCQIYVPSSAVSAYQSASGWSEYASRIQAIPTT